MKKVDLDKWAKYFEARNNGQGVDASAKKARLSTSSAYRFERGDQPPDRPPVGRGPRMSPNDCSESST